MKRFTLTLLERCTAAADVGFVGLHARQYDCTFLVVCDALHCKNIGVFISAKVEGPYDAASRPVIITLYIELGVECNQEATIVGGCLKHLATSAVFARWYQ